MSDKIPFSYAAMKGFIREMTKIIMPHVVGNPKLDPMLLAAMLEDTGRLSYAKEGARQALADLVGRTAYWSNEQVSAIDQHLSQQGCLTVSQVRAAQSSQLQKIVRRKAIVDDEELYLVVGVLSDMAGLLDLAKAQLLQSLIDQYSE